MSERLQCDVIKICGTSYLLVFHIIGIKDSKVWLGLYFIVLQEMEVMRRRMILHARHLWISSHFMKGHSKWDNIKNTKVHFRNTFTSCCALI